MATSSLPITASPADIEADKKNFKDSWAFLADDSKSPDEKRAAYVNMVNSLHEPHKTMYNILLEEIKAKIKEVQSSTARAAAEKYLQPWETGAMFLTKEETKKVEEKIFEPLSDADKNVLLGLKKHFNVRFAETFKDIMPTRAEEETE